MGVVNKLVVVLIAVVVIFASILYFSSNLEMNKLTGYVAAESGNSNTVPPQQTPNRVMGILKGQVEYTITDNNEVVDTEPAPNITVYFVPEGNQIIDFTMVRLSANDGYYRGIINNIDVDGLSSPMCSRNTYDTQLNYYDNNNNNQEDSEEFLIYIVVTDINGCYAVRLPADSYDIFI